MSLPLPTTPALNVPDHPSEHPVITVAPSWRWDFALRLPLVGWGGFVVTGNLSVIFQQVADWSKSSGDSERWLAIAGGLANILFFALIVVFTLRRLPPIRQYADLTPKILGFAGAFLTLALIPFAAKPVDPLLSALSTGMVVIGLVMAALALRGLNTAFSVLPEARVLVTTGPYALVRHPLYVCEEIAIIGIAIKALSTATVIIVCLHLAIQFARIRYEENILRAAFPEYPAYEQRVPRFFPRIQRGRASQA